MKLLPALLLVALPGLSISATPLVTPAYLADVHDREAVQATIVLRGSHDQGDRGVLRHDGVTSVADA